MKQSEHIRKLINKEKNEFAEDFDNIVLNEMKNRDEKNRDEEQIKEMIDYTRKKLGRDFFLSQRNHINKESKRQK